MSPTTTRSVLGLRSTRWIAASVSGAASTASIAASVASPATAPAACRADGAAAPATGPPRPGARRRREVMAQVPHSIAEPRTPAERLHPPNRVNKRRNHAIQVMWSVRAGVASAPGSPVNGDVGNSPGGMHEHRRTEAERRLEPGRRRDGRYSYVEETRGDGWVLFAGVMLAMLAVLNLIDGIAAVSNSSFFTDNAKYVLSGLNTWGWVLICIGVVQGLAAYGVWARVKGVRWLGVGIAALNGIIQLIVIDAYPFWSLTMFTLDILVIYGLVAYGGSASDADSRRGS